MKNPNSLDDASQGRVDASELPVPTSHIDALVELIDKTFSDLNITPQIEDDPGPKTEQKPGLYQSAFSSIVFPSAFRGLK